MSQCKNCNYDLSEVDKYCPNCGQKTTAHILTIKELFVNFWSSVFNLDNTLFRTLRYIWAPWKLTQMYVEGKRQSFFNPMRLFLVTLLFHFGYLVSLTNIDNKTTRSQEEFNKLERSNLYEKYVGVKENFPADKALKQYSDSIEAHLFQNVTLPEKDTFMNQNIFGKSYPITRKDAIEMSIDSIYKKYNITTFLEKLEIKQLIRINLDRAGTIKYALGNAAWGLLTAVFFLGLLFKLLYVRQKKFYVEHLIFWMNVHSTGFITVSLIIFFAKRFSQNEEFQSGFLSIALLILLPALVLVSMYKYYGQSIFKTIIKFLLTGMFYIVIGLTIVLIVSLISLAFF